MIQRGFLQRLFKRPSKEAPTVYSTTKSRISALHCSNDQTELLEALKHHNGYLREAAVLRLGELTIPAMLPHIIERANDWVPQVKWAAYTTIESYMRKDAYDAILENLPNFHQLKTRTRHNHQELIIRIEKWLAAHTRSKSLPKKILSYRGNLTADILDLCWNYRLEEPYALMQTAARAKGALVQKRALYYFTQLYPLDQARLAKDILAKSESTPLTYLSLRVMAEHSPADAANYAPRFLLSPRPLLRELAERICSLTPRTLSKIRCDALLNPHSKTSTILTALRLCGINKDKSSEHLIHASMLTHAKASFRGEALLALARIAPNKYNEEILRTISAIETAEARPACRAFIESNLALPLDKWGERVAMIDTVGQYHRLNALAKKHGKWVHLGYLLECLNRKKFSDLSLQHAKTWTNTFNRSFVVISPEERQWIVRNLSNPDLPAALLKEIQFYIG